MSPAEVKTVDVKSKNRWQAQEIGALLNAYEQHQSLRVYLQDRADVLSSSLLGFDLDKAELLLDTLHPFSRFDMAILVDRQAGLTLAINAGPETWFLDCVMHKLERDVLIVRLRHMRRAFGRRLHPRMQFASGRRPLAEVRTGWSPLLRGELLDLSAFGCQLRMVGADQRQHFNERKAQLALYFNEEFELLCEAELKQMFFLRKPCCHNILRLMFKNLNPLQIEQLQTFILSATFSAAA